MTEDIRILKQQLKDYQKLFNEAEVAITIVDQNAVCVDCNSAYKKLPEFMELVIPPTKVSPLYSHFFLIFWPPKNIRL